MTKKTLHEYVKLFEIRTIKGGCGTMTKREIKAALREIAKEMETATGCELISLEERKTDLEMILSRKRGIFS